MATLNYLGIIFIVYFQLYLLFQAATDPPMYSLEATGFAFVCGGIAFLLLSQHHSSTAEERGRLLKQRKKVPLSPRQRASRPATELSSKIPPSSPSSKKFILTPKTETFPIEITRPVRTTTQQQQSASFRSASSGRVAKSMFIHKGLSKSAPARIDCSFITKNRSRSPARPPQIIKAPAAASSPTAPPPSSPALSPRARSSPTMARSAEATQSPETARSLETAGSFETTRNPKAVSPKSERSPQTIQNPRAGSDVTSMKSPPLQAVSESHKGNTSETPGRRRLSNFTFLPQEAAQLRRLDPRTTSPKNVYGAICSCIRQSGVPQPSVFHIHVAASLLKHCPDQSFYDYLNLKQAEEIQQRNDGDMTPASQILQNQEATREAEMTESNNSSESDEIDDGHFYIDMMSGSVQSEDAHILDPRRHRRPKFIGPANDKIICDANLPFKEQVRLQPFRLVSKAQLHQFSSLFFDTHYIIRQIEDDYYSTNFGLYVVTTKATAHQRKAQAVLALITNEEDRLAIMQEADDQTILWLYRLGGYFDESHEAYLERGSVRYPEDLIPWSAELSGSQREWSEEEQYFWRSLWDKSAKFWDTVGFKGEYGEDGYVLENDSESSKWWQAHLLWEEDRKKGRKPRTVKIE